MNKKYQKLILIILAAFIFLIPTYHPEADSGFDGSYSGGSSSSSSWSGSSSSWSSSSHYGSGRYSSSNSDPLGTLITLIIILVVVAYIIKNSKQTSSTNLTTSLSNVPPYNPEKFKKFVLDFNEEEFKNQAYEIYKKVQIAWMNFDYDSIRQSVTDEMYNMYKSQLTTLKVKKQTNIMKDFELIGFKIIGMEVKENLASLTTVMQVSCYDYIIDKDGKVVRGNDKRKVTYTYSMTFNKGMSEKPNKCPNCNAPLENVNSSTCPYCDSTIIGDNYDWILAKKQVLSQTENTKK